MACVLCGADGAVPVHTTAAWSVVRCPGCGLVRTAEQPTEERLAEIYGESYFTGRSEHGVDYVGDPRVGAYDAARFRDTLDLLEPRRPARGHLLDIGCATGHFMLAARDRGWEVSGCELSPDAARLAEQSHGLRVHCGVPSEAGFGEPFDAITMNHVLEHIPSPVTYLAEEVAPLLAHGGVLLVEVPNIESIQSRVNGASWADLRPEQHLFHFSAETLTRLLEAAGFEVLERTTLAEPQLRIRGPLVYLGVPDPPAPAASAAATPRPAPDGRARVALRRAARFASLPFARFYARRLMELRLVVVARVAR